MSDENKFLGKLPMVGFDDAVAFFRQRTGTSPCPACGHNQWDVSDSFGEPTKMGWGLSAVNLETGLTIQVGMPLIYAECRKCAFLRMHDMRAVAKWIEQGKPEFKLDE